MSETPFSNDSDSPFHNTTDNLTSSVDEAVKKTVEETKERVQNVYNEAPQEVKVVVEQSKSFYEANKKVINTVVISAVVMRIYKKKIARTTAKAVLKVLEQQKEIGFVERQNFPTLFEIWNDLKANPELAYIPHGGGMVHLLGPSKDIIVTVFGNFEKMNTEQIFAYAGRALGMRGY